MSYYTTNNFSSFWSDYSDTSSVDEFLGIEEKKREEKEAEKLAKLEKLTRPDIAAKDKTSS